MAKLDITKITGYEAMTPEQKIAALEAFEYEDNSSELERIKNALSKSNSEAADWKKKHNALLSEEEQKKMANEEALTAMQTELATLRKDKIVSAHTTKLLALGYDEALAVETATALADGDTEKVFANQKKFLDTKEKTWKSDALKKTPVPEPGKPPKVDKPEFGKMSLDEIESYFKDHPKDE